MRRTLAIGLGTLLVLSGSIALGAGPASAGDCPGLPDADGRLKPPGGAFLYDGTYDDEPVLHPVDVGESEDFVVRYRNRKANPKTIQLGADVQASSAFRVKFLIGDDNVTAALTAGGVSFAGIPPGGSTPALTMRIKHRNGTDPAAQIFVSVAGRYTKGQSCNGDTMAVQIKPG